jgi:hypothetical protein
VDLVILVLVVALIGWLVYWITTTIPMHPTLQAVIQIAAAVVLIIYVLRRLGIVIGNVL